MESETFLSVVFVWLNNPYDNCVQTGTHIHKYDVSYVDCACVFCCLLFV